MDVTQTEYHIHHVAGATAHHGSSLAEEVSGVSQRQDRNRSLKCILKRENVQVVFGRQASTSSHLNYTDCLKSYT